MVERCSYSYRRWRLPACSMFIKFIAFRVRVLPFLLSVRDRELGPTMSGGNT